MVKKIVWSARAQNNRKKILQYWIETNKTTTYSKKLNFLFNEATNLILKPALRGYKPRRAGFKRLLLI